MPYVISRTYEAPNTSVMTNAEAKANYAWWLTVPSHVMFGSEPLAKVLYEVLDRYYVMPEQRMRRKLPGRRNQNFRVDQ